ncbi:MAG: WXG100 family type VII secretion target [Chloroflexota bacterium]
MSNEKVQANYDELATVADRFDEQATGIEGHLQKVKQSVEALQRGGWVGQGANAFFAEMEDEVLPAVQRLVVALADSCKTCSQINDTLQTAEEEAAGPFKNLDSSANGSEKLGSLSEKYETGGRGPGTVSSGSGDPGGVSYGLYQMTSRGGGTVAKFLQSPEGAPYAAEFAGLTPGSEAFTQKWQEIAAREPGKFGDAQHAYIQKTHYDPLVSKVSKETGLDVSTRSAVLRDVIWSTSVQHGPSTSLVNRALAGRNPATLSDEEIVKSIYAERGRTDANGNLVYFSNSSRSVQQGVANRFRREQQDALDRLSREVKVE